jgi:hypothetical protein
VLPRLSIVHDRSGSNGSPVRSFQRRMWDSTLMFAVFVFSHQFFV